MPPHLKVFLQRPQPGCALRIEQVAEQFSAAPRCATVLDLQTLAVIGDDREQVRPGADALARPQRFEQTKRQRVQAEQLQSQANPAQRPGRSCAIAPKQKRQRQQQARSSRPEPIPAGEDQRRQGHHAILTAGIVADNSGCFWGAGRDRSSTGDMLPLFSQFLLVTPDQIGVAVWNGIAVNKRVSSEPQSSLALIPGHLAPND